MKILVNNLVKKFGDKVAVDDISFQVRPGQVLGLLGPNGAGKSTTIKILSGQMIPTSGEIIIDEKKYNSIPAKYRGAIGVMPQEIVIWEDLTIKENLKFSSVLQGMDSSDADKRINYLIEALQFGKELKTISRNLSGGYKRRLNLAISIIHKPSLIFLDEPSPGIDAQSRRVLMDFIEELGHKEGLSVVLTDHYLDEAEKLSDYIIIIDDGKIVAEGTIGQLKKEHGDGNFLHIEFDPKDLLNSKTSEVIHKKLMPSMKGMTLKKNTVNALISDPVLAMKQSMDVLNSNNIKALNISVKEPSLEDIFLLLTGKEIRE